MIFQLQGETNSNYYRRLQAIWRDRSKLIEDLCSGPYLDEDAKDKLRGLLDNTKQLILNEVRISKFFMEGHSTAYIITIDQKYRTNFHDGVYYLVDREYPEDWEGALYSSSDFTDMILSYIIDRTVEGEEYEARLIQSMEKNPFDSLSPENLGEEEEVRQHLLDLTDVSCCWTCACYPDLDRNEERRIVRLICPWRDRGGYSHDEDRVYTNWYPLDTDGTITPETMDAMVREWNNLQEARPEK